MSALKALNFVAVPKQAANDPVQARRNKLITQLEQQRELAKDENYVVKRQKWVKQEDGGKQLDDLPKRVKRWWRVDGAGNCLLILRAALNAKRLETIGQAVWQASPVLAMLF